MCWEWWSNKTSAGSLESPRDDDPGSHLEGSHLVEA